MVIKERFAYEQTKEKCREKTTTKFKKGAVASVLTTPDICYYIPDIDECTSSPCKNAATCNDHINGYTCTCGPGFTGTHCEIGKYLFEKSQNKNTL